jgi:glycosyltransferase involved in cell wall biosynthesis
MIGKVIIQIPCHNEAESLPVTLAELPRKLVGVAAVESLVIDDGSTDGTSEVARGLGVDHVVRFPVRRGLAAAFAAGIDACLARGADVIVNTDADNQYRSDDIPLLLEPIARGAADIVIGARPVRTTRHFSPAKRFFQRLGSRVVRLASNTTVADAPSGFRAMTSDAAMRIQILSGYTYTLEMIIQAGHSGLTIASVPVRTNPDLRKSRLVRSMSSYISRSALTIVRIFMAYQPFRFFAVPGALAFLAGFLIALRFLYFYVTGGGTGHIQSLILSALLMGSGFFLVIVSLLADLLAVNRKLLENTLWRVRRLEYERQRERAEDREPQVD